MMSERRGVQLSMYTPKERAKKGVSFCAQIPDFYIPDFARSFMSVSSFVSLLILVSLSFFSLSPPPFCVNPNTFVHIRSHHVQFTPP